MSSDPHARPALPRVVVTGMGVVSCIGNGQAAFHDALRCSRNGVRTIPTFAQLGMSSHVGGAVDLADLDEPPRKHRRYLGLPATYAWHAMNEAIAQAGFDIGAISSTQCGIVIGGGTSFGEYDAAVEVLNGKGIGRVSPFTVPRAMGSNLSASLAHAFGTRGVAQTISSACTSSAHAIGHAMELIQLGKQQVVFCGGSEELHPRTAVGFDVMGALSSNSNDAPENASRPYDMDRDGFVLAAGAGMLVLESLSHAQARGATILAELSGYGSSTDPASMVGPGAEGIAQSMRLALAHVTAPPDYINTHACSTPQGDLAEWQAIGSVFAEARWAVPPLSSIKSLIGHAPGASSALDAIASILMMQQGFLSAGRPVRSPDPAFADAPLIGQLRQLPIHSVLSNSFGFGGTSASLLFTRMMERPA